MRTEELVRRGIQPTSLRSLSTDQELDLETNLKNTVNESKSNKICVTD